mgnify:CR=1 FL=1
METNNEHIKIGIGVIVFKNGKTLLGKRKNTNGNGEQEYATPGGHMEFMESFEQCARREVKEETGMEIENIKFLDLYNHKTPTKHYINVGLTADWKSGEPQNLEPDKCESWDWYDLEHLPSPLYGTTPNYIEALRSGKNFFDA